MEKESGNTAKNKNKNTSGVVLNISAAFSNKSEIRSDKDAMMKINYSLK